MVGRVSAYITFCWALETAGPRLRRAKLCIILQDAPWQLMAGRNSPARLAPLQPPAAVANQHYASNGHSTDIEQRLAVTEARAAAAERAAVEAARLAELTGQRLTGLTGDMARATAELGDLRGRYDAASSLNGQVRSPSSSCLLIDLLGVN